MQSMPRMIGRLIAVIGLISFVAACQPYTLVKAGSPTRVASVMTVTPKKTWNALGSQLTTGFHDTVELWTADSQILNQLMFIGGMEDGEKIFRRTTPPIPAFSAKANTQELAEFVRSVMASSSASTATELETRPMKFLNQDGVLTEFDLPYPDGTPGKMLAAAVISDGKLYMIAWRGVGDLYYNTRKAEVEKIMASARLGGKA